MRLPPAAIQARPSIGLVVGFATLILASSPLHLEGVGVPYSFGMSVTVPTLNTIIVAHQGTNNSQTEGDLADLDFSFTSPNSSLFPGIPPSVEAHNSFASVIFTAVQPGMSQSGSANVIIVGHSLGAALALLDSVYLPLHLPAGALSKA